MSYKPGDTLIRTYTTYSPTTFNSEDATLTDAAVIRNGVRDDDVNISITKIGTGLYVASIVIPLTYNLADRVEIMISVQNGAVSETVIIESVQLSLVSVSVTLNPALVTVPTGIVMGESVIVAYQNETKTFTFVIEDADGEPIDLSDKDVRFTASQREVMNTPTIIHDNDLVGGLVVTGDDDNVVEVTMDGDDTATTGSLFYAIWDVTENVVLTRGRYDVHEISQLEE